MSIGPSGPTAPRAGASAQVSGQAIRAAATSASTTTKTFLEVLSEGRRSNPIPALLGPNTGPKAAQDSANRRATGSSGGTAPPPNLRAVVERTLQAEAKVDVLIAAAARGRTFSPGELIALQATVFRYSQTVEVISRGADRLIGSLKQTLGTQV